MIINKLKTSTYVEINRKSFHIIFHFMLIQLAYFHNFKTQTLQITSKSIILVIKSHYKTEKQHT